MKKTSKLARLFSFFWLKAKDADPTWDALLNKLIDKAEVTEVNEYTMTFDDKYVVWVANHPFASGSLYEVKGEFSRMGLCSDRVHCSTKTKIRLEDFYHSIVDEVDELSVFLNKTLEKYQ